MDGCFHRLCAARLGVGAVSALAGGAGAALPACPAGGRTAHRADRHQPAPGLLHADDRRTAAGQRSAVGVLGSDDLRLPGTVRHHPGLDRLGGRHHAGAGRWMAAGVRLARPDRLWRAPPEIGRRTAGPGAAAGFFMAAGVAVPVCACLAGAHPLHAAGTQCCGGAAVCGGAA